MIIQREHLIESVAAALQYISCYHPKDFIDSLYQAYQREESAAARDAMAQILVNSRMCAEGLRPICQDTGMVVCFAEVGMQVSWDCDDSLQRMIDEGVRRAYRDPHNPLRASMVADPLGARGNSRDNTPAILHTRLVPGDKLHIKLAAKGGGSENKARFQVLTPNSSLADWVAATLPGMGAGWCPPGILGIGVGGSAEQAMLLAKESLFDPIDMPQLLARGARDRREELRIEIYRRVNELGIGAQGLGGLTTVLDVKILDYPTHAASLPVAMIPNCAATRHIEFTLDASGPAQFQPPSLDDWPQLDYDGDTGSQRVSLDEIDENTMASWQTGQRLLLSGRILTGRDAAHRRIQQLLERGQPLPDGVDFRNRFIYYVGPVDPVGDEVVGPAGPTTSTRMDGYSEVMLGTLGLRGMIGKAERGPIALEAIRKHRSVYLIAVGGAAYLVAKAIRSSRLIAFEDLGMEAIREFEVVDMPVTVAVDTRGNSIHQSGPRQWARVSGP
jgi:fumarate hydratase class I